MDHIDVAKHRAFEAVFRHFDPSGTGSINTKDFLNLIDELDAMQPDSAEPIINSDQRENAAAVVEAGIAMSRAEVLDFLEELGVTFQMPGSPSVEEDGILPVDPVQPAESVRRSSTGAWSDWKGRFGNDSMRPGTNDENSQMPCMPTKAAPCLPESYDYDEAESMLHRSHSPLAQSTPHKDSPYARQFVGKPNRSPAHNRTNLSVRSKSYAYGPTESPPVDPPSNRYAASNWSHKDEVHQLQTQVRILQDREKVSERTISTHEQQIHRLGILVAETQQELSQSDRAATDLRASHAAAEATIQSLEKNVTYAHNELSSCQAKLERAKSEIELQISESDRMSRVEAEQSREIIKLRAQLQMVSGDQKNAQLEKTNLLADIDVLQSQCESLRSIADELVKARQSSSEKDRIIHQLTIDLDDMKKASMRKTRTYTAENDFSTSHGASVSKESQTIEKQIFDANIQGVKLTEGVKDETSGLQEEAMKQHYATLSNELGLQRNLIDKMIKMKAGIKKQKIKARSNGVQVGPSTSGPIQAPGDTCFIALTKSHWLVAWPLIILYSFVFLGLGYILATQSSAVNAPGVSYAELKSWERANAIDYVLDYHGVMGHSANYRWWEGGWLWVEMLGYWLEEKLIDHAWPS